MRVVTFFLITQIKEFGNLKLNFNILNLDSKLKKDGSYGFIIVFSSDSLIKTDMHDCMLPQCTLSFKYSTINYLM